MGVYKSLHTVFNVIIFFSVYYTLGLVTNNNQDVIKSHLQCSVKRLGTEITDR